MWPFACSVWHNQGSSAPQKSMMCHARLKSAVLDVQWTTDGERVLSTFPDKSVRTYNFAQQWLTCTVHARARDAMLHCAGHKNAVLEVQWTTVGEWMLSASPDKSVRGWHLAETAAHIS